MAAGLGSSQSLPRVVVVLQETKTAHWNTDGIFKQVDSRFSSYFAVLQAC